MPDYRGFIGPAYSARSPVFDAQRCINLYYEKSESGTSKSDAALIGTPGLKTWVELPGNTVRGCIDFDGVSAFVCVGRFVYKLNKLGGYTLTGTVPNLTTPAVFASNGTTIFMVTGSKGYIINPVLNTMTEFIDVSFTGADRVEFTNGSFVFNQPGTGKFWAMDPYSTVLDPLSYATAEGSPDALVTLLVSHNEIWLFGTQTTEIWVYNGDTANFPYARVDGAFIDQGCAAPHSVARVDMHVLWLSANDKGQGTVFQSEGFSANRVSTHAMERTIAKYETISDAVAYTYQQEGHSWYVLNFPTANTTWCYDCTTGLWHERLWRQSDGLWGRHRSNCHMYFGRKNLVGDWQSGKIYELDLDVYTDDGNPLIRLRAAPHVTADMVKIPHIAVQFDIETGVGLQSGQGSDPVALLRWSDDGGRKWSSQREKKIGRVGEYKARVRYTRLGSARDRVYELSISDPVKVVLIGAYLNAT